MNNNKFFEIIITAILTETQISSIEFLDVENLPMSEIKITIKTGSGFVALTFDYHANCVAIESINNVKSSYLQKMTAILQKIENAVRQQTV